MAYITVSDCSIRVTALLKYFDFYSISEILEGGMFPLCPPPPDLPLLNVRDILAYPGAFQHIFDYKPRPHYRYM